MFARLFNSLQHHLTPRISNNFRAKLLHNSGIFALMGILLSFNLLIRLLDNPTLHILGFSSSITIDEVVRATNEERVSAGLPALRYSETLADAARRKAANMFEEDYWAHNSPSGINPWFWFKQAGYSYVHAGENLAKDFGSTDRMLAAWMDSPTHRDNIVSANYDEIGIAVVPGTLQGQETVLVVQLFGSLGGGSVPTVSEVQPSTKGLATEADPEPTLVPLATPAPALVDQNEVSAMPVNISEIQVNEFSLKQAISIATTIFLLFTLLLDLFLAESRSLSRRVGKNWAHIIFINVILILVTIAQAGRIL